MDNKTIAVMMILSVVCVVGAVLYSNNSMKDSFDKYINMRGGELSFSGKGGDEEKDDALTMISHSEYMSGEQGQILSRLLDYQGYSISTANCSVDVLYPDRTYFINSDAMNYNMGSYYYNFTVPSIEGVYQYRATCVYGAPSKTRSIMNSFHVSPALNFIEIAYDNLSNQITNLSDLTNAQFGDVKYNLTQIKADTDYIRNNMQDASTASAQYNDIVSKLDDIADFCGNNYTSSSLLCLWVNESKERLENINETILSVVNLTVSQLLEDSLSSILSNISDMQGDIDLLIGYTDTLEAGQQTIIADIAGLDSKIDSMQSDITLLIASVSNISLGIYNLNITMTERFDLIDSSLLSIFSEIQSIENKLDCNNTVNIICDKLEDIYDINIQINETITNLYSYMLTNATIATEELVELINMLKSMLEGELGLETDYYVYNYGETVRISTLLFNTTYFVLDGITYNTTEILVNASVSEGRHIIQGYGFDSLTGNLYAYDTVEILVVRNTTLYVSYRAVSYASSLSHKDLCMDSVVLKNYRDDVVMNSSYVVYGYNSNGTCLQNITDQPHGRYNLTIVVTPQNEWSMNFAKNVTYEYSIENACPTINRVWINDPDYCRQMMCHVHLNVSDPESDTYNITNVEWYLSSPSETNFPSLDENITHQYNIPTSPEGYAYDFYVSSWELGNAVYAGTRIGVTIDCKDCNVTYMSDYILVDNTDYDGGGVVCVPRWTPYYTSCLIDNSMVLYYVDEAYCNTSLYVPPANGSVLYCDYCAPSVTGPYYDPNECTSGDQVKYYIDSNYAVCCAVTSLPSDCPTDYGYANTTSNCSALKKDIQIMAMTEPYLEDKMEFLADINISNSTKCWSYVEKEGKILQTNPQKKQYTQTLFTSNEVEDREFFTPVMGKINAYYTDENLMPNEEFTLGIKCALDDGRIVSGEKVITPQYNDLREVTARSVWGVKEFPVLIFAGLFIGALLIFLIWAWRK